MKAVRLKIASVDDERVGTKKAAPPAGKVLTRYSTSGDLSEASHADPIRSSRWHGPLGSPTRSGAGTPRRVRRATPKRPPGPFEQVSIQREAGVVDLRSGLEHRDGDGRRRVDDRLAAVVSSAGCGANIRRGRAEVCESLPSFRPTAPRSRSQLGPGRSAPVVPAPRDAMRHSRPA
jgi:hypothetical protein